MHSLRAAIFNFPNVNDRLAPLSQISHFANNPKNNINFHLLANRLKLKSPQLHHMLSLITVV